MRRILLVLLVAVVGVTAFFVFHHPPMRLMPPPLMFVDDGTHVTDVGAALAIDQQIDLFYATTRLPAGPRHDRIYTVAPDWRMHLGTATTRIGDDASTLDQLREWSTGGAESDRPFIHLQRMNEAATVETVAEPGAEALAWLAAIEAELQRSRSRDVLIYVHGANTTVERAAGQAAQLKHFAGREAVVVLFAWPTAENFLRYLSDVRTAFGAAPHLADLVELISTHTSADRVGIFTYSAGAIVGSDALAELGRDRPKVAARIGEVYHAAPDADFRGFVDDLAVYAPLARRVTMAVNLGDSALRLAGVVNRASRAGRPDLRELSPETSDRLLAAAEDDTIDIVQVQPETMPYLSATSHTFWYDDPWVSNDVLITLLLHLAPPERELDAGTSLSGARYWTFGADYAERIAARRIALQARLQAE